MDEPRRNDVFDRELRRALAAGGGAPAGPHLDAEMAAAWIERRLDAAEQRVVETHLADCHDCQAVLATLAQISPEEAPASAEGFLWWRRLRAGWLVPAAVAAAAALVIWVAVPQQRNASPPVREFATARSAPSPSAAPRPPGSPAVAQREEDSTRGAAPQPSELQGKADGQRQAARLADRTLESPLSAGALERRDRAAEAPPAAAPDSANATAKVEAERPSADAQRVQSDKRITVTGESPAAPPPAPARQEVAAQRPRALDETITISGARPAGIADGSTTVATDGAARWRRDGPRIEFAPRAGASFAQASLPVAADTLVAAAAPGGAVCWMAGRAGIVVVTTDGVRFVRTAVPAPVNLVAITATDDRTATVTATDGRRFRTTDQGASWTALP